MALVGVTVWIVLAGLWPAAEAGQIVSVPVIAGLLALFATMVVAGGRRRAADREVHDAIEAEAPDARLLVLRELLWLLPALAAGVAVYVSLVLMPALGKGWEAAVRWGPWDFAPLGGVTFAAHGAIIGALAGWIIRIVFTLVFGREAFGTGDIYILAAAGAAGGWDIALLGFALAVGIALLAWPITLLMKRTVMIPFGPPLALGMVAALWLNSVGAALAGEYTEPIVIAWHERPEALGLLAGVVLVGGAVAIMVAKLIRHWVEPDA